MIIDCWWMQDPLPGNMGDIITPVILDKMFNVKANWVDTKKTTTQHFIMTGSILKFTSPKTTVWGSGVIREIDEPSPDAEYLSVRGPLSYEIVRVHGGDVKDIFGDPAMLLPFFHKNNKQKKYKIGILPHYVDYKSVVELYKTEPDIKVIDILNVDPLSVVDEMLECEKIVTSSLHGVIVCNAYNIPVSLVKYSNLLYGDGIKFKDHLLSVGVNSFTMHDVTEKLSLKHLEKLSYIKDTSLDCTKMINAFQKKLMVVKHV